MLSETFRTEIETFATALRRDNALFGGIRAGTIGPNAVAAHATTLGCLLRHTVPSIAMAREYALIEGKQDLACYYERKIDEERGHYHWAAADLDRLQSACGAVLPREPVAGTLEFLQDLRAAIANNPSSYLSYMVLAESITAMLGPEWVELLETRCNIPRSAVTAVDRHVELDRDHAAHGLRVLDELVRDDADVEPMLALLQRFMRYLESMSTEIARTPN